MLEFLESVRSRQVQAVQAALASNPELANCRDKHGTGALCALHLAAKAGNTELLRVLLDAGAEIDKPDGTGGTALEHAAREGHFEACKLLVAAGANVMRTRAIWRPKDDRAQHRELDAFMLAAWREARRRNDSGPK